MPSTHPHHATAAVAALALTAGVGTAALADAASSAAAPASAPACTPQPDTDDLMGTAADINADGWSDLVTGVPSAAASGLAGAGVVDVHYLHVTDGLASQRFGAAYFGETPAAGDHFGASTAYTVPAAQYGCKGLAIGAPDADGGAGTVTVAYGTNQGISPDDATVLTGARPGDHFGAVVVSGGDEIWVAAPDADVDGHAGAGAVYDYGYDPSAGTASLQHVITEDTPGVPGTAAAGDHFGQALATSQFGNGLAVGMPGKTVDGAAGAGAVAMLSIDSTSGDLLSAAVATQNSPQVPGGAGAGDGLGSSLSFLNSTLAVGVPGEDIGSIRNAGSVQLFVNGTSTLLEPRQAITQETPTIPGGSETGDRFGAAVQGVEDTTEDICIGAPGESIGDVRASGDVICTERGSDDTFTYSGQTLRLGTGMPGESQTAAHVGASLGVLSASDDFGEGITGGNGLVVDVPALDRDGVNTGEVAIGDTAYQDTAGPPQGEFFGGAASNMSNGPFDD